MSIANFEEFCEGLCELVGLPSPQLQADARGTLAFTMRLRGVAVTALELSQFEGRKAFLVAEFGALPQGDALAGWLALMDANSVLPDVDSPRFSRNPHSGEVVMQWPCLLHDVTASDVYQRVVSMVDAALQWRRNRFREAPQFPASTPVQVGGASAVGASAKFRDLYLALCDTLGQPAQPMPGDGCACAFELHVDGVDVVVAHLPQHRQEVALVGVPFGTAMPASRLDYVTAMMDANFALIAEPHGAAFCRDPASDELLLRYACPLASADARQCLGEMVNVAAFAREWTTFTLEGVDDGESYVSTQAIGTPEFA